MTRRRVETIGLLLAIGLGVFVFVSALTSGPNTEFNVFMVILTFLTLAAGIAMVDADKRKNRT